jgi:hypothetical protein
MTIKTTLQSFYTHLSSCRLPLRPVAAATLLLLVACVPWLRWPGAGSTHIAEQNAASPYRFTVGERLIYQLHYHNSSASDMRALFSEAGADAAQQRNLEHKFTTDVRGELTMTVLKRADNHVVLACNVRQPEVGLSYDGQERVDEARQIAIDLARGAFVEVDPQGRVVAVRFDPAVSNVAQGYVRALLGMTQFVFAQDQQDVATQWETQEDDSNGQYVALYKIEPESDQSTNAAQAQGKAYRKTKLRYLPSNRKSLRTGDPTTKITPQGSLIARFDHTGGHLISIAGTEAQTVSVVGKNIAQSKTTVNLSYLRKEALGATELSGLRAMLEKTNGSAPLSATESDEEREANIHRNELGEATLDGLLAELAKVEKTPNQDAETALYLKIKALVHLRPESCARLGQILAAADPQSLTMRLLTEALGRVGHAEAQAALVATIQARPADWLAVSLLIPTLGSVSLPTTQSEAALRELVAHAAAPEIASTAQLALGAMARSLTESSPDRAARIVDEAAKGLNSSSEEETARRLLLTLGNAMAARSLPTIARFAVHTSPSLRASAMCALRGISAAQADELLIKALASDADAKVRAEAAVALGYREMTAASFAAHKQTLFADQAESVRLAVLNNLWQAHEAFPEAQRLVTEAAEKDPSKTLRQAARELITGKN